jgi:hypothetical protein
LTCYGGNKFMNSDRYKKFFDRVVTFWLHTKTKLINNFRKNQSKNEVKS